jgi:hypothetical protein
VAKGNSHGHRDATWHHLAYSGRMFSGKVNRRKPMGRANRLTLWIGLVESFSMAFLALTFDARGDNYHGIASKGSNRGDHERPKTFVPARHRRRGSWFDFWSTRGVSQKMHRASQMNAVMKIPGRTGNDRGASSTGDRHYSQPIQAERWARVNGHIHYNKS